MGIPGVRNLSSQIELSLFTTQVRSRSRISNQIRVKFSTDQTDVHCPLGQKKKKTQLLEDLISLLSVARKSRLIEKEIAVDQTHRVTRLCGLLSHLGESSFRSTIAGCEGGIMEEGGIRFQNLEREVN